MSSEKSRRSFQQERNELNALVLEEGGVGIRRFFNLDHSAYNEGALSAKTKEMLGLVASLVLRCDDCIFYHLIRAKEEGMHDEEFREVMNIGLVVGGSIVIPHLRKAFSRWEQFKDKGENNE
ncbi:MAG TPA: carboxymuconolactone decarboxylase family protein [Firmicutes bacterium]|nr:carboxymuconolactone decarboxylase family protein [Bacillota bacterium]